MIYIITPCSRPENLEAISQTIPPECVWAIVHDNKTSTPLVDNALILKCEDNGLVGTKARNYALDTLPLSDNDYVLFHDDDNIIYPKWYLAISQLTSYDFSLLTWGQLNKDNSIRLEPQVSPKVGNIDTASFLVSWAYNKSVRHRTDIYEHDGVYAMECANNGPTIAIDDYLCYYNYLR